jgi:hypothetical protein
VNFNYCTSVILIPLLSTDLTLLGRTNERTDSRSPIYPNLFLAEVYKSYQKLTLEIKKKSTYGQEYLLVNFNYCTSVILIPLLSTDLTLLLWFPNLKEARRDEKV